jgi:hypothetical protein
MAARAYRARGGMAVRARSIPANADIGGGKCRILPARPQADRSAVFLTRVSRSRATLADRAPQRHASTGTSAWRLSCCALGMRSICTFTASLALFHALFACESGEPPTGSDALPRAALIAITTGIPPDLVAFRDGTSGAWQPATPRDATTFEAIAHGPYMVTVVCTDSRGDFVSTWQYGRIPEDEHEIAVPCASIPPGAHTVTGHVVQPGSVQLATSVASSGNAEWNFSLAVARGTYDLIASTGERIAIRRGIVVDGDAAIAPPIDFAQEGTALVDGAFTVTNADADEQMFARVTVQNPTTGSRPARVYLGPLARAKVAPDAVLLETDTQVVTMIGLTTPDVPIGKFRSLQRPFRVGGNAVFAFPKHLVGAEWAVENGDLTARWIALPDFARFDFTARTLARFHELDVSPGFVEVLDERKLTLDTAVPGYARDWRIDLAGSYDRRLVTFKGSGTGVVAISEVNERVNMGAAVTVEPRAR